MDGARVGVLLGEEGARVRKGVMVGFREGARVGFREGFREGVWVDNVGLAVGEPGR